MEQRARALIKEAVAENDGSKLEKVSRELLKALELGKPDACEELFILCAETAVKVGYFVLQTKFTMNNFFTVLHQPRWIYRILPCSGAKHDCMSVRSFPFTQASL